VDRSQKLKILRSMDTALADPALHQRKSKRIRMVVFATAWLGFFASFLLFFQGLIGIYLPILASLSGVLLGIALFLGNSIKQWPLLAEHVSRESVREQISELET